jgi:predicted PurR-regulated permease PerM
MSENPTSISTQQFTRNAVEATIRIGVLLVLVAWCFQITRPFIGPIVWGVIIAIAIFPIHRVLLTLLGGRNGLSASLLTVVMLVVLVWPTFVLTGALLDNLQLLLDTLDAGSLDVPPPPEGVASWPVIGPTLYQFWDLASTNLDAALTELQPQIEAVAGWLLSAAAGTGLGVLQFVLSIIISGILIAHSAAGHGIAQKFAIRLSGDRGSTFVDLAEATVRGVARGVIGVAFIQMLLVGLGLGIAGVPWAGLWTFLALLLAIMQVGVAPIMIGAIIYMFTTADTLPAVLFLIYGVFVSAIDNVLKPLLMGRGLDVPMAIILVGTIGGMLTSGIVGLFIGAVVLAVGYKLFMTWLDEEIPAAA